MKKILHISCFSEILLSISIPLLIIILAVKLTLNFKAIYYYSIVDLDLPSSSNLSVSEIKKNYNYIVDYMQSPNYEFKLPTLPYSKEGKIHFEEVRNIFYLFNKLVYILFFAIILLFILNLKNHRYTFLKCSSIILIIFPILILIPFAINFDKSFTLFHKLAFNNDYWLLDPNLDPIINIMPQKFFFNCSIFIVMILILNSYILYRIYRKCVYLK